MSDTLTTPIELTSKEEGVASLRIATDEQPYLHAAIVPALSAAVAQIAADEGVRVVVVEGGRRKFSSGASRETLLQADARKAVRDFCAEVPRLLLSIPVPTIAAMAGHGVGGGLILGLWCDMVVLAEESLYGANFIQLGFTPGMGSTAILPEVLGPVLAQEVLFSGRMFKGRELAAAGIPVPILPREEVADRVMTMAREIAAAPRDAVVLLKGTLSTDRKNRLEDALVEEQRMHEILFANPETWARIAEEYGNSGEESR